MALRVLGAAIAGYGLAAFVRRGLPTYMLLQTHFVFFDFGEPMALFYLDYLAMMGTFVWLGHGAMRLLRGVRRQMPREIHRGMRKGVFEDASGRKSEV